MLIRSRRPLKGRSLELMEKLQSYEPSSVRERGNLPFIGGLVGAFAPLLYQATLPLGFHVEVVVAMAILTPLGGVMGELAERWRIRKRRKERARESAANWGPTVAEGYVDHLSATVTKAVRLDDEEGDITWFLQVEEDTILCVPSIRDHAISEHATEGIEIDYVQARDDTILSAEWMGEQLPPLREKRFFKHSERHPQDCEILTGRLEQLDELLRVPPRKDSRGEIPAPAAKLARDLEPLGFYKFVPPDYLKHAKKSVSDDAAEWFSMVERAFFFDPERLAKGGVKDYLDYLRPALRVEGCEVGHLEERFEEALGYRIRAGGREYTMWSESEVQESSALTVARAARLLNMWLAEAGSEERIHLMGEEGADGFALLTPAMWKVLAESQVFQKDDIPQLP